MRMPTVLHEMLKGKEDYHSVVSWLSAHNKAAYKAWYTEHGRLTAKGVPALVDDMWPHLVKFITNHYTPKYKDE